MIIRGQGKFTYVWGDEKKGMRERESSKGIKSMETWLTLVDTAMLKACFKLFCLVLEVKKLLSLFGRCPKWQEVERFESNWRTWRMSMSMDDVQVMNKSNNI